MSSREIAELTGKRNTHVLADIRIMLNELTQPIFRPGYNVQMRPRIVDPGPI